MSPFPDPKADALTPDATLQDAFNEAVSPFRQALAQVPIVIVALSEGAASHGMAGQLEPEVHYSASLLKVAAMYAAFELRHAANALLLDIRPAAADVIPTLSAKFDGVIDLNRVDQLNGVPKSFLLPRWSDVFGVDAATGTVNFSARFFGNLFDAIAEGNNEAAGEVVHGLGFGYLTKAVAEADFFKPATAEGIWLCGDFGHGFPAQRIPCANDGPTGVAQATSALQMARLFTLLASGAPLVAPDADAAMLNMLQQAITPQRRHFFLNRDATVNFVTLHSKIGLGPLQNGTRVASEAAIIQENSTGQRFVVVFQNLPFLNDNSVRPVSQVVDATVASFTFR